VSEQRVGAGIVRRKWIYGRVACVRDRVHPIYDDSYLRALPLPVVGKS
jgi:hypothetical protein